jgi:hypothetical protein
LPYGQPARTAELSKGAVKKEKPPFFLLIFWQRWFVAGLWLCRAKTFQFPFEFYGGRSSGKPPFFLLELPFS